MYKKSNDYEHSIHDIKQMLHQQIYDVGYKLFPNAKQEGKELCIGSMDGEPGKSLKLCLEGPKIGVWFEFNGTEGGDIISLWARKFNLSDTEAILDIREYLGIPLPKIMEPAARKFVSPELKATDLKPNSPVYEYLTKVRMLTPETLSVFQVKEKGRWVVYPYYRGGQLKLIKEIHLDLDASGKKQIRASANSEPSLFGLDIGPLDTRILIIVEGEIDAMTLYQYGMKAKIVSVPFGGGGGGKQNWVQYVYDLLTCFDTIFLCLDDDEVGELATQELITRLGRHRCMLVKLPYKDANECLQRGVQFAEIEACFANAKSLDPEQLVSADKYRETLLKFINALDDQKTGYALPFAFSQEKVRFRPSELSVWTGICGHGKSMILGYLMLHCMQQGARVCIASLEMQPERVLMRMIRQTSGLTRPDKEEIDQVFDWYMDKLWLYKQLGSVDPDKLLDVFKYAYHRYGIDTFIVDSLMMCGIDEDDYNAQKAFVNKLCAFKNQYHCHIHLVAHPRKKEDEKFAPGKMDIKGTGAIVDLADNCFTIWANVHQDENPEDYRDEKTNRALSCTKQRNGEWHGTLEMWFDKDSLQYLDNKFKKPMQLTDFTIREEN